MQLSKFGKTLVVVLLLSFIGTFLLTPLGFETRPVGDVRPLGQLALALVFVAAGLNVVALLLLPRHPQWAARFAAVGPFLFAPGLLADQSGNFSTFSPPFRITVVEYAQFSLEVIVGILAFWVHREWTRRGNLPGETPRLSPER